MSISLVNVVKYFKDQPHQVKALQRLQEQIAQARPDLLAEDSMFLKIWRQQAAAPAQAKVAVQAIAQKGSVNGKTSGKTAVKAPVQTAVAAKPPAAGKVSAPSGGKVAAPAAKTNTPAAKTSTPAAKTNAPTPAAKAASAGNAGHKPWVKSDGSVKLDVPFLSQLDNVNNPHGSCNVTSVSMCMAYFGEPTSANGQQLEDTLYQYMESNGLSRHSPDDLRKVLLTYGYQDDFQVDAKWADVKAWLDQGKPCITHGWFTQSGHIICIIGYNSQGWIVHDPYGEWHSDGYDTNKSGANLVYSFNMMKDVCGPDGDLWIHYVSGKPGQAIPAAKAATPAAKAATPAAKVSAPAVKPSAKPSLPISLKAIVDQKTTLAFSQVAQITTIVKEAQQRLIDLKVLNDVADGLYGRKTEAALVKFAKAFKLPDDRITPEFANTLLTATEVPGLKPAASASSGAGSALNTFIDHATAAEVMGAKRSDVDQYLPPLIEGLHGKKMLNKPTLVAALATISVETGGFQPICEWGGPQYFTEMYEGREDLGNTQPGDGARYFGRGFVQITGRANYRHYGEKLGVDMEGNPDLALDPDVASKVLVEYFWERSVDEYAMKDDWEGVRRAVNGGLNGWDHFWPVVQKLLNAVNG